MKFLILMVAFAALVVSHPEIDDPLKAADSLTHEETSGEMEARESDSVGLLSSSSSVDPESDTEDEEKVSSHQAALSTSAKEPGYAADEIDRHREWPANGSVSRKVAAIKARKQRKAKKAKKAKKSKKFGKLKKKWAKKGKKGTKQCYLPYRAGRKACRDVGRKLCTRRCKKFSYKPKKGLKGKKARKAARKAAKKAFKQAKRCRKVCYRAFKKSCYRHVAKRAHKCLSKKFGKKRVARVVKRLNKLSKRRMPSALKAYLRQAGAYAYGLGPHPAAFGLLPYAPNAHRAALLNYLHPALAAPGLLPYPAPFVPIINQQQQQQQQQQQSSSASKNIYPAPLTANPGILVHPLALHPALYSSYFGNPVLPFGAQPNVFNPSFVANPFLPVPPKGTAPITLDSKN